jgi:hypothetical protein
MNLQELKEKQKDYLKKCEQIQACLQWSDVKLTTELLRAKSEIDSEFAPIREALFEAEGRHDPIIEGIKKQGE